MKRKMKRFFRNIINISAIAIMLLFAGKGVRAGEPVPDSYYVGLSEQAMQKKTLYAGTPNETTIRVPKYYNLNRSGGNGGLPGARSPLYVYDFEYEKKKGKAPEKEGWTAYCARGRFKIASSAEDYQTVYNKQYYTDQISQDVAFAMKFKDKTSPEVIQNIVWASQVWASDYALNQEEAERKKERDKVIPSGELIYYNRYYKHGLANAIVERSGKAFFQTMNNSEPMVARAETFANFQYLVANASLRTKNTSLLVNTSTPDLINLTDIKSPAANFENYESDALKAIVNQESGEITVGPYQVDLYLDGDADGKADDTGRITEQKLPGVQTTMGELLYNEIMMQNPKQAQLPETTFAYGAFGVNIGYIKDVKGKEENKTDQKLNVAFDMEAEVTKNFEKGGYTSDKIELLRKDGSVIVEGFPKFGEEFYVKYKVQDRNRTVAKIQPFLKIRYMDKLNASAGIYTAHGSLGKIEPTDKTENIDLVEMSDTTLEKFEISAKFVDISAKLDFENFLFYTAENFAKDTKFENEEMNWNSILGTDKKIEEGYDKLKQIYNYTMDKIQENMKNRSIDNIFEKNQWGLGIKTIEASPLTDNGSYRYPKFRNVEFKSKTEFKKEEGQTPSDEGRAGKFNALPKLIRFENNEDEKTFSKEDLPYIYTGPLDSLEDNQNIKLYYPNIAVEGMDPVTLGYIMKKDSNGDYVLAEKVAKTITIDEATQTTKDIYVSDLGYNEETEFEETEKRYAFIPDTHTNSNGDKPAKIIEKITREYIEKYGRLGFRLDDPIRGGAGFVFSSEGSDLQTGTIPVEPIKVEPYTETFKDDGVVQKTYPNEDIFEEEDSSGRKNVGKGGDVGLILAIRKGWMDLSLGMTNKYLNMMLGGNVWTTIKGYKDGSEQKGDFGKLVKDHYVLAGIQVNLYDATLANNGALTQSTDRGVLVASTMTDETGDYGFQLLNPMHKYFVEFKFNGMQYKKAMSGENNVADGRINNTADELAESRNAVNDRFSTISADPKSYQNGKAFGYISKIKNNDEYLPYDNKVVEQGGEAVNQGALRYCDLLYELHTAATHKNYFRRSEVGMFLSYTPVGLFDGYENYKNSTKTNTMEKIGRVVSDDVKTKEIAGEPHFENTISNKKPLIDGLSVTSREELEITLAPRYTNYLLFEKGSLDPVKSKKEEQELINDYVKKSGTQRIIEQDITKTATFFNVMEKDIGLPSNEDDYLKRAELEYEYKFKDEIYKFNYKVLYTRYLLEKELIQGEPGTFGTFRNGYTEKAWNAAQEYIKNNPNAHKSSSFKSTKKEDQIFKFANGINEELLKLTENKPNIGETKIAKAEEKREVTSRAPGVRPSDISEFDAAWTYMMDTMVTARNTKVYPEPNKFVLWDIGTYDDKHEKQGVTFQGQEYPALYTAEYDFARNVNFGITPRKETDLALQKDLYKARILVNGTDMTYKYAGKTWDDYAQLITDDNLRTKADSLYKRVNDNLYNGNESYGREIRKSEYLYNPNEAYGTNSNNKKMQVYLTYRIGIKNLGDTRTSVDEIVDYYDGYYLTYDGNNPHINADTYHSDIHDPIKRGITNPQYYKASKTSDTETPLNNIRDYTALYIKGMGVLEPGDSRFAYITFVLNTDETGRVLITQDLESGKLKQGIKNFAEINKYSSAESSEDARGIVDRNSIAGSVTEGDFDDDGDIKTSNIAYQNRLEGDIDKAPNLIVYIPVNDNNQKIIRGTIFEDERTQNSDQALIGDGILNGKDKKIDGVTVELVELVKEVDQYGNATGNYIGEHIWESKYYPLKSIGNGKYAVDDLNIRNDSKRYYSGKVTENGVETKVIISGEKDQNNFLYVEPIKLTEDNGRGAYGFSSVVSGDYIVRYTYGDTTQTVLVKDVNSNEVNKLLNNGERTLMDEARKTIFINDRTPFITDKNGNSGFITTNGRDIVGLNEKSYNGQDYKSTVYQKDLPQVTSSNANGHRTGVKPYIDMDSQNYTNKDGILNNGTNKLSMFYYDIENSNSNDKMSDAKDIEYYRRKVNNWSQYNDVDGKLKNYRNEILRSFEKVGTERLADSTGKIPEGIDELLASPDQRLRQIEMLQEFMQNTKMVATTGVINLETERNTVLVEDQAKPENRFGTYNPGSGINELGNKPKDKAYDNDLSYQINHLNLGLTQRPEAQLKLTKNISNFRITLANGTTLFDTNKSVNNLFFANHEGHKHTYNSQGKLVDAVVNYKNSTRTPELVQAVLDEELMAGANINVTYDLIVENVGEVDYLDNQFYYTGKTNDKSEKNISKTSAKTVIDYVTNMSKFSRANQNADGQGWRERNISEVILSRLGKDNKNDNLVNIEYKSDLETFNTMITTEDLAKPVATGNGLETGLLPMIATNDRSKNKSETSLVLTALVSSINNANDLVYNNLAEIVESYNSQGRRMQHSINGNQRMANQSLGGDAEFDGQVDNRFSQYSSADLVNIAEIDADSSQKILLLPPTGENRDYEKVIIPLIITLLTVFGVLGVTIVYIIKKKKI